MKNIKNHLFSLSFFLPFLLYPTPIFFPFLSFFLTKTRREWKRIKGGGQKQEKAEGRSKRRWFKNKKRGGGDREIYEGGGGGGAVGGSGGR